MKEENIKILVKAGILRPRQIDAEKINSMIRSAELNIKVIKNLSFNEESATVIFREAYESIRQLGDAYWWVLGYEPSNHEISLESLKELEIKDKLKLNHLPRFKQIRHDANYKGFKVTMAQSKEILEFWDSCSKDIIFIIKSKMNKKKEE